MKTGDEQSHRGALSLLVSWKWIGSGPEAVLPDCAAPDESRGWSRTPWLARLGTLATLGTLGCPPSELSHPADPQQATSSADWPAAARCTV